MRAKDVMTTEVVTVTKDTPVTEIAKTMAENKVSGVPVVNDSECVVGIVTEDDLLLKHDMVKHPPRLALFGLWVLPEESVEKSYCKARCEATAADIMTKNVMTFEEEDNVQTIAEQMVKSGVNRVPIVKDCKLVGIITREDIIRSIAAGKY